MNINPDLKGYITNIQNFSIHDGPGVRTTVFFKGCPLKCLWCANPETWQGDEGIWMTPNELMGKIQSQSIFFRNTGGGVTFSGGEPTVQSEFLAEMVNRLYALGIDITIETCGYFEFQTVLPIFEKVDLIYFDIKHIESLMHQSLCGVANELILENLKRCYEAGFNIIIRMPLIKGVNTDEGIVQKTADFISESLKGTSIELLPFHRFGDKKYDILGINRPSSDFKAPSDHEIAGIIEIFRSKGCHCFISYSDSHPAEF